MNRDDGRVLETRLAQLRQRLRRLYWGYGVATLVILVSLITIVSFGADYLLDLPQGVRLVFLVAALSAIAITVIRRLAYPLRKPLTDDELALLLEKTHPELQARLISAVQLARHHGEWNESKALIEAVVAEGRQLADGVDLGRVLDARPVQRRTGIAAALILGAAGLLAFNSDLAGIWWQRFLGSSIRWPQKTFLRLILPEDDPSLFVERRDGEINIRVARGGALPLNVEVEGVIPESVDLVQQLITESGDDEPRLGLEKRLPMQRRGEREFQLRFRDLIDSFVFHIEGGDDTDGERVRVDVIMPPEIEDIQVAYDYPDYTGLENQTLDQGNIDAPIGTRVTITARSTLPLEEATFVVDGQPVGPMKLIDDEQVQYRMPIVGTAQYSFQLRGQNRLSNQKPGVYAIRAIKDQKPAVRLYSPSRVQIDATPNAVVPLRAAVQDDYGVADIELHYRLMGASDPRVTPLTDAYVVGNFGDKRLVVFYPFEISQLELVDDTGATRTVLEGDTLEYSLEAHDYQSTADGQPIPNLGETQSYHIDIVSASELIRRISERQVRLKEMTKNLRRLQESTFEEFEALRGIFADGGDLQPADQSRLVRIEIDQNRVTNDALALTQELASLFQTYLFNRIEASHQIDKLIGVIDELARSGEYLESYEPELYREIVTIYASGQLGDLDITGKVLGLVQLSQHVAIELSPAAYRDLAEGRKSPDASVMTEAFSRASEKQKAVLDTLDVLLTKMEEWEDYQEVLQLARELEDLQRQIHERTRKEFNK
ncbi:MAG: DUF4175 family protein [Planctomycetota bacterium]